MTSKTLYRPAILTIDETSYDVEIQCSTIDEPLQIKPLESLRQALCEIQPEELAPPEHIDSTPEVAQTLSTDQTPPAKSSPTNTNK